MSPEANKDLYRKTWSRFPTGVSVITFYEADGKTVHGLTANAVSSVSLDPMLVLVCVDHKARSFPLMSKSERFVMNFLTEAQSEPLRYFARNDTTGAPPFKFRKSARGYPILEGSYAFMDCIVYAKHLAGDHTLFLGKVDEIDVTDAKPVVWYMGKLTSVAPPQV